jgi:hypothetical protein
MQMRSKVGETLHKRLIVRVFSPENKASYLVQRVAPAGQGFTPSSITSMLDELGSRIEKKFPDHEYRLVELAPNRFNFVWECKRSQQGSVT